MRHTLGLVSMPPGSSHETHTHNLTSMTWSSLSQVFELTRPRNFQVIGFQTIISLKRKSKQWEIEL